MSRILVTGAAGFIGARLCQRLIADGHTVEGVDDLNGRSYDPALKRARVAHVAQGGPFTLHQGDIADTAWLADAIRGPFDWGVHLAAEAGVRRSVVSPRDFVSSNVLGTTNVLEACRHAGVDHLIYASSSSVYGGTDPAGVPSHEDLPTTRPASPYAATKIATEALAHAWSHAHGLPATGLRLFSVYGPWGRPDMALYRFTRRILAGTALPLYNHGRMARDFTYVDDVIEVIVRLSGCPPPDHRVVNVGTGHAVDLGHLVRTLEDALGRRAEVDLQPMQTGDVVHSCANVERLRALAGFVPHTDLATGVGAFVAWYLRFHATE